MAEQNDEAETIMLPCSESEDDEVHLRNPKRTRNRFAKDGYQLVHNNNNKKPYERLHFRGTPGILFE